jgi:uncharacterized membrane protein
MTETRPAPTRSAATTTAPPSYVTADEGKVPAFIVYALYIAGVFSAHLISPVGVIVAYVCRDGASPWVRSHFDQQVGMFWVVFWWMIAPFLIGIGLITLLPVIGAIAAIPLLIVWGVAAVVTTIWFAIKSVMGLLRLINSQPA